MSIFKGIRFLGIVAGWLVDEGLTMSSSVVMLLIATVIVRAVGGTEFSLLSLESSTPWTILMFFIGNACTVVGGFVTGCIAKSHRVKNGLALWIFEYIRFSYLWLYPSTDSFWFSSLGNITNIASACLGAWIAKLILGPGKAH